jgi:Zn-dependent protease with chaperone function
VSSTALGLAFLLAYALITLIAPFALSRPWLLISRPRLCLRLWMGTFFTAAACLTVGLGTFIALALRHYVDIVHPRDTIGPLIDAILGWLSLAIVGILAFRLAIEIQDARTAVDAATREFAPLLSFAQPQVIGSRKIFVMKSSIPLMGARAGRVLTTTAMVGRLSPEQLEVVAEHEFAHLSLRHDRVLAIANLSEAIAPAIRAGSGFASAARITTELIADDFAARRFGDRATAEALNAAYPDDIGVAERVARLTTRLSGARPK